MIQRIALLVSDMQDHEAAENVRIRVIGELLSPENAELAYQFADELLDTVVQLSVEAVTECLVDMEEVLPYLTGAQTRRYVDLYLNWMNIETESQARMFEGIESLWRHMCPAEHERVLNIVVDRLDAGGLANLYGAIERITTSKNEDLVERMTAALVRFARTVGIEAGVVGGLCNALAFSGKLQRLLRLNRTLVTESRELLARALDPDPITPMTDDEELLDDMLLGDWYPPSLTAAFLFAHFLGTLTDEARRRTVARFDSLDPVDAAYCGMALLRDAVSSPESYRNVSWTGVVQGILDYAFANYVFRTMNSLYDPSVVTELMSSLRWARRLGVNVETFTPSVEGFQRFLYDEIALTSVSATVFKEFDRLHSGEDGPPPVVEETGQLEPCENVIRKYLLQFGDLDELPDDYAEELMRRLIDNGLRGLPQLFTISLQED